jgi:hypothetical protein
MLKSVGLCRERRAIEAASNWVDMLCSTGIRDKMAEGVLRSSVTVEEGLE